MGLAVKQENLIVRTGLGEEGAETVIGVSGLALIGQVAIGLRGDNASVIGTATILEWRAYLNTVFETVKLSGRRRS